MAGREIAAPFPVCQTRPPVIESKEVLKRFVNQARAHRVQYVLLNALMVGLLINVSISGVVS